MKEKIAFVCQRYGLEVNGGAEMYCRQVAEKLSAVYDVTVYTTCAIDYVTWKNEYHPGTEVINGVEVRRFRSKKERSQRGFDKISAAVLGDPGHSDALEEEWIDQQGPLCPDLLAALDRDKDQYKKILFMTYLYYTTARGILPGYDNAMLIPTVHDEPPVYLRFYDRVFSKAKSIVWNTEEERAFANRRFSFLKDVPGDVVGMGIEMPKNELPEIPEALQGTRYLVYAGRIDESKGCGELFTFFQRYRQENGSDLRLVLMGKPVMKIPEDPAIISLGFVSEEMKYAVMQQAFALVLCSRFESFSIVVLESMMMGRPVLVSGHCEVLKGHCLRSNAGLYFNNYLEFEGTLNYLLSHPAQYEVMRENGKKYVDGHYQWDIIIEKYRKLIEET